MTLEFAGMCARVAALFANKRFLSTMNEHMGFQVCSVDACVATLIANVGLLFTMLKNVHFEVFGCLERDIGLKT